MGIQVVLLWNGQHHIATCCELTLNHDVIEVL